MDKKLVDRLPKMEVMFKFPNLYPGTRTVIVLKQPKTDGSIRNVYTPDTVTQKLSVLRRMQDKLKQELGSDGYMDYGLMICQANGRPIMTEHLNKRFKDVLIAMGDPNVPAEDVVFHSIRHTSAGVKLRLSKGDLKAVQGDAGQAQLKMVSDVYSYILDEDRRLNADKLEKVFYRHQKPVEKDPAQPEIVQTAAATDDAAKVLELLNKSPELTTQLLQLLGGVVSQGTVCAPSAN